jgi:hypothetical protein
MELTVTEFVLVVAISYAFGTFIGIMIGKK